MTLADEVRKHRVARLSPLWEGPNGQGKCGGVTQSLLGRYLSCPERCRVGLMEGLRPAEEFEYRREYGSAWHVCEDGHARGIDPFHRGPTHPGSKVLTWGELGAYCQGLCRRFPAQQGQIQHMHYMVRSLFPEYLEFWVARPPAQPKVSLVQEQVFSVPYRLPSGRTVRLRGKWDGVSLLGEGKGRGIVMDEHKTKSEVNQAKVERQLAGDLQVMFYLVALLTKQEDGSLSEIVTPDGLVKKLPIVGVTYNVVRRSSHKSPESMLKKVREDVAAGRGGEWFGRWDVAVSKQDLELFRRRTLDPILDNLVDDHQFWQACWLGEHGLSQDDLFDGEKRSRVFPYHWRRHFLTPFHYDPLSEGGGSDLDGYIRDGSTVGLRRAEVLFPELED